MVKVCVLEVVKNFNQRTTVGRVVVNPPDKVAADHIKLYKLKDEWFICKCGKGYSNFESYQKHMIDHENSPIDLKPTWSYPKFNPNNNNKDLQQQVKIKSNNNNNNTKKKTNGNQSNPKNNGKVKFLSKLKSVDSSKIATRSIKCKICHRFFYYVGRLRQHMDAQHPEEAKNFVVPKINKKKQKTIIKTTVKKGNGSLHLQKVNKLKKILNNLPKSSKVIPSEKDLKLTNSTTKSKINKTNKPGSKILKDSTTTTKKTTKNITLGNNLNNKLPILKDKKVRKHLFPCPHCLRKTNNFCSENSLSNHIKLKHFDKVSTNERIIPVVANTTTTTNSQPTSASSSLPPEEQITAVKKRRKRKLLTLQGKKIAKCNARKSALNSLGNSQIDDYVNNLLPPVLKPIPKKLQRKSTKCDTNTTTTTTTTVVNGVSGEQVPKNRGVFFYDAIGTRTRSRNMDEDISPPTLDLMEDKLHDHSIQSHNNNNNNNDNNILPNNLKTLYSKNKIQTEKKPPQQSSSEKLACTFCVHKFASHTALQLHLKHHKVLGVYNQMKGNKNNNKINSNNTSSVVHRGRQNSVKPTTDVVVGNKISKSPVELTNVSSKLAVKMKRSLLSPPRLSPAPGIITKSPINSLLKNQSPNSSLSSSSQATESIKSPAAGKGNVPCKLCPKMFAEDRYLKVHMLAHTRFKCSVCSKAFAFKRHLEKHKKEIHRHRKLNDQTIPSKVTTAVVSESSNTNMYLQPDSVIGQRSQRAKKLLLEVQTSSIATTSNSEEKSKQQRDSLIKAGNLVTCSTCNIRISKYMLHHHHKIVHATQIEYKCERCTRSFDSFRALESHKRLTHNLNVSLSPTPPPQEKTKEPSCLRMRIEKKRNGRLKTNFIVPDTVNNNNNTGKPVQESHKVQETMQCDLCKFDIPGAAEGVLLHKQVAHVKHGAFQCNFCSCRYRTKTGLASHLRNKTHTEENMKTAVNGTNGQIDDNKLSPSASIKSKPGLNISSTSSVSDISNIKKPSSPIIKIKDEEEIKFQKDSMTVPKIICYYSQNPEFLRTQNSPQKNTNLKNNSQNSYPPTTTTCSSSSSNNNNNNSSMNNNGDKVKHHEFPGSHYGIKDKSITITPINNQLNNNLKTPPRTEKVSTTINNLKRSFSNLSSKNSNSNNNNSSLAGRNLDIQSITSDFQRVTTSMKHSSILKQPLSTTASSSNKFRSSYPTLSAQQQSKTNLPQVVTCNICDKNFFSEKRLSAHIQEHMVEDQTKQEKCGYCGNRYSRDDIFTHLQHCRGVNSPNTTPTKNENLK